MTTHPFAVYLGGARAFVIRRLAEDRGDRIRADAPTVRIGFARQAWVFLNGQPVYSGENHYYSEERRLSPNDRLEADNASITLDLRREGTSLSSRSAMTGARTRIFTSHRSTDACLSVPLPA